MGLKIPRNPEAVAWLEGGLDSLTEIEDSHLVDLGGWGAHYSHTARGAYGARRKGNFVKAMYDLYYLDASSSFRVKAYEPCPACDNFAYSARCEDHPDEGTEGLSRGAGRHAQLLDRAYDRTCGWQAEVERSRNAVMRADGTIEWDTARTVEPIGERFSGFFASAPVPDEGDFSDLH